MCGGWSKGGKKGKRSVARGRLHHENPPKSDACVVITAFYYGWGSLRRCHFETLLGIGPDIQPRVVISTKATPATPTARRRGSAASSVIPDKANEKNKPAFFARVLDKAAGASSRARTAQALKRVALRSEKTPKLQINRLLRSRLRLTKFVHTASDAKIVGDVDLGSVTYSNRRSAPYSADLKRDASSTTQRYRSRTISSVLFPTPIRAQTHLLLDSNLDPRQRRSSEK